MRIAIILILLCCSNALWATKQFEYSPMARQAYDNIVELRFQDARLIIAQLKVEEPNNLIVHHLEDYIDFFTVYIGENQQEYNRLYPNRQKRLNAIQDGDKKSPYYLYLQADIRLHWALGGLKFGDYYSTLTEINKAFKLLERNAEKFPNFIANKKDLGMLHAMVSTIPDNYKRIISWVTSLEGTFEEGRRELEQVISYSKKNDFVFEAETYILYAYVMLYFGNEGEQAWSIMQNSSLRNKLDPMSTFVRATVAMKTGRNDQAIKILKARSQNRNFHPYHYLDFMLGQAKLRRLDNDASLYLNKYIQNFKGRNYVKECYRHLAWYELIQGQNESYRKYMEKVKRYGYDFLDNDKSALAEANLGEEPHPAVLKARLLFDGGYYQRAYETLQATSADAMPTDKSKLEYTYFLGRTTHKLQQYEEALQYYQQTITLGRNASWYFACRAALEQGVIYEFQGKKTAAKKAFSNCLSIRPSEHRFGLHQKAKAGLSRLR